jgi:hypothetical protein
MDWESRTVQPPGHGYFSPRSRPLRMPPVVSVPA